MRPDMFKVIVERPRRGGKCSHKGRRLPLEHLPSMEGMRAHHVRHGDWKSLNENLAPLRRYLCKQVGRLWDKVYSEICQTLDTNSTVKEHVRSHIEDFVAVRVRVGMDGSLCVHHRYWGTNDAWQQELFVDPSSGLLRQSCSLRSSKIAWKRRRQSWSDNQIRRGRKKRENDRGVVVVSEREEIHRVDGIWYRIRFAEMPPPQLETWVDGNTKGEWSVHPVRYNVLKRRSVADVERYPRQAMQNYAHFYIEQRSLTFAERRCRSWIDGVAETQSGLAAITAIGTPRIASALP